MKDAADYLTYIKALMVVNPQVLRWTVVREEVQGDMGMLRYRSHCVAAVCWRYSSGSR